MLFVGAWGHPRCFGVVRVAHLFSFLWYVVLLRFVCLCPVPCVLGVADISGLFILRFSLPFICTFRLTVNTSGLWLLIGECIQDRCYAIFQYWEIAKLFKTIFLETIFWCTVKWKIVIFLYTLYFSRTAHGNKN